MYKKSYLLLYLLLSGNLLLLSGCLNKQAQTKPEVQTESITNIEVETPSKIETETIAEITPEQQQDTATQKPALAAQQAVAKAIYLERSAQLSELISTGNVVVDFYATWCGPCKSVSPTIDRLAQQYAGKVLFVKVDVDKFKDLANKFNIKGMPTFHFYKNGSKVDSFSGGRDKAAFEQKIKSHFNV